MKLTNNVLKAVLAGALVLSSVSHAETSTVALQSQRDKIEFVQKKFEELRQHNIELMQLNAALASAEETAGNYELVLRRGETFTKIGATLALPSGGAIYGMHVTPELKISQVAKKPTYAVAAIAGVAIVGGFIVEYVYSDKLVIPKAEMKKAQANIAAMSALIQQDKETITANARDLGAKIENNIISFEGLGNLTTLGGSTMNLNDLAAVAATRR